MAGLRETVGAAKGKAEAEMEPGEEAIKEEEEAEMESGETTKEEEAKVESAKVFQQPSKAFGNVCAVGPCEAAEATREQ